MGLNDTKVTFSEKNHICAEKKLGLFLRSPLAAVRSFAY